MRFSAFFFYTTLVIKRLLTNSLANKVSNSMVSAIDQKMRHLQSDDGARKPYYHLDTLRRSFNNEFEFFLKLNVLFRGGKFSSIPTILCALFF